MPRSVLISVVGIPPAGNQTTRSHRMENHREKTVWQEAIEWQLIQMRRSGEWDGQRFERAHVRAEFWFKERRRRDPDNHAACLKGLLDGMVQGGLLRDDDFEHIELQITYGGIRKRRSGIDFYVTEIVEEAG